MHGSLKYDETKMQADIQKFGLFTYKEFRNIIPVSEDIFNALGAKYYTVAIGKGLLTLDNLAALFETYKDKLQLKTV